MGSRFIGIDGGGTGCRARVLNAEGVLLAEVSGGSGNIHSGGARAIAMLAETCERAAGRGAVHIGAGLAGVVSAASGEAAAAALAAALTASGRLTPLTVTVDNDAYTACLGAHGGADGGIVLTGTGSAALARVAGHRHELGGWGFALGDDGSGALMGRAAARHALRAADGLEPGATLAAAVLDVLGRDRDGPTQWSATARPRDYAQFAPAVLAAADAGDAAALVIVAEAVAGVAALVSRLLELGAPAVCVMGGLAPALTPKLPQALRQLIRPPLADAMDGALLMARQAAAASGP
jgi:glucosamine kinase